ncbi:hypothetical protein M9Y10_028738 [Tritrichomonas musculus]|uniref:DUF3447 domain-containing protein n=1 Tax=Tritrichomonas musculus TaxID=1915356 RepID=A0ABR2KL09_9EUKA
MDIKPFVNKMKEIQGKLLEYLDKESDIEENFQNFIQVLNDQDIFNNKSEFKLILYLILRVSINHHRSIQFYEKNNSILTYFKDTIIKYFTNNEIFNIFKKDKVLLLFLIKNNTLKIDDQLVKEILGIRGYMHFFVKEIASYFQGQQLEVDSSKKEDDEHFEQSRKLGESDSYICQLIRNDKIEEFITFVNKYNYDLNSPTEITIFNTNKLLDNKRTTLIEYATFFGSIQIFKYLYLNKVKLSPSLWIHAIHSDNEEIIKYLEQNKLKLDSNFEEVYKEAIICHHNEMAIYIQKKYLKKKKVDCFAECIKSFNFSFFANDFAGHLSEFVRYDYLPIVEILLKNKKIDVNKKTILSIFYFLI